MPDDAQAAVSQTEVPLLQLRIVAGVHEGACVPLPQGGVQGLQVANHDDADIWITDAVFPQGDQAWLYVHAQHWALLPAPVDTAQLAAWAQSSELGPDEVAPHALPVGTPQWLGPVCVVVCAASAPWQTVPSPETAIAGHDVEEAVTTEHMAHDNTQRPAQVAVQRVQVAETGAPQAEDVDDAPLPPLPGSTSDTASVPTALGRRAVGVSVCVLGLAALLAALLWWWRSAPTAPEAARAQTVSAAEQQQQVQAARWAIATVDPTLRLQIEPHWQGGVRVAGWLSDQDKLDQVVQALATLRPLPQIALRTMADLNDAMQEVGQAFGMHLRMRPAAGSQVQVTGMLRSEAQRADVLAAVQQRLPEGLQLVDGLQLPPAYGTVVAQWLQGLGLDVREVIWKNDAMHLHVHLRSGQRRRLEQALVRQGHPLEGIPFHLLTADASGPAVAGGVTRLAANAPGVPVAVRTVVGGTHPYVVTRDGLKLQPGAQVGPWRLVHIAADYVQWDGPRRVEVAR